MAATQIYSDNDFLLNIREEDTAESFSKRTGISPMTVKRRFKSWNNLRALAGLTTRPQGRPDKYSMEQLVAMVEPGDNVLAYCIRTGVARNTIYNRVGSWSKLVEMAKYSKHLAG